MCTILIVHVHICTQVVFYVHMCMYMYLRMYQVFNTLQQETPQGYAILSVALYFCTCIYD